MSYTDFVKNGCNNVTTLAFNGGCTEEIERYGDRNFQSVGDGQTRGRKGSCGRPDVADKLWAPPQGAEGWLWHYMIKIDTPDEFEPALLTNRSCNTTTCDRSICTDGDCYDSTQNSCQGWYETSGCNKNNPNWDNSTMDEKTCTRQLDHLIRKGADTVTVATTEKHGCVASQTLLNVTMFVSASRLQLAKVAMPSLVLQILKLVRVAKRP